MEPDNANETVLAPDPRDIAWSFEVVKLKDGRAFARVLIEDREEWRALGDDPTMNGIIQMYEMIIGA